MMWFAVGFAALVASAYLMMNEAWLWSVALVPFGAWMIILGLRQRRAHEAEIMSLDELVSLCKSVASQESGETISAYLLVPEKEPPTDSDVNRTAGHPIGVSDERWPRIAGKKMAHALTVDVRSMPEVRAHLSDHTAALSVFVSDLWYHEAYEPDTNESAVLELSEDDLLIGVNEDLRRSCDDDISAKSHRFLSARVDIPIEVYDFELQEGRRESDPLNRLALELYQVGMAAAESMSREDDEYDAPLLIQFAQGLVDMNFGDAGRFCVYPKTAFQIYG